VDIGLIDVDGHNFPNLALMKISAWHKCQGDAVEWCLPLKHYDVVYVSKVFDKTYSADILYTPNADKVIYGGTGYGLDNKLTDDIEHICPDYTLYPQYNYALGFLTRGCPNACPFCIVSEKEGRKTVKVADLVEFYRGQKEIKLLDANLLAAREHLDLLRQLADSGAWVDFTQGLDARLITDENASALASVRTKTVHFAFDLMRNEDAIVRGLQLYKKHTKVRTEDSGVYILTNFDTTHKQDIYRARKVEELGYRPYVMIYDKPHAPKLTKHLQRWANNRIIYASEPDFYKYKPGKGAITIRELYKEALN
jgi:hypothetical protein